MNWFLPLPSTAAIAHFRRRLFLTIRSVFLCLITFAAAAAFIFYSSRLANSRFTWFGEAVQSGNVYHSPEVFKLDYAEMEREFKVYMYPEYNYGGPAIPSTISGKYASEAYFFKNIKESAFLTNDPDQAHLFFIPISCHRLHQKVLSYDKMGSIVQEYVKGLAQRYPYWNRTLGTDHFVLTCHEIGVGATKKVRFLAKNAIRVVCSASYGTDFIPHKDVSLPLVMQPFSKPTGHEMHGRSILGYWAGNRNSKTRKKLVKHWGKDKELDIQNSTAYASDRMEKFYRSKFCICPVGSTVNSNRIAMAIHYGCVPVILADHFHLPFNNVLDWQKFSVIVKERDIFKLKKILKAKVGKSYRILHSNLLEVQKHFQWNAVPLKFDTFHMILYQLWLRRNVVKYF
ncbi:Exostosin family protein [Striga hermonthica]|uniref:Exostosin family protein n=1 Tax=Striga hermonthica TaxID=68872 RepID=A0A9N7MM04_STRHE|nr:Exostosin family protein [Striga hermonthica]